MRRRAISVDLIPEVEDECIDDLASFCFEKTKKGEEMQCLQDNLDKLQTKCRVSHGIIQRAAVHLSIYFLFVLVESRNGIYRK